MTRTHDRSQSDLDPQLLLIARAEQCGARTAIVDSEGAYTYSDLLEASARVAANLLANRRDLSEERVAFLIEPGFAWVTVLWGIWRSGGIGVPLPLSASKAELRYILSDTEPSAAVFTDSTKHLIAALLAESEVRALRWEDIGALNTVNLPAISLQRRAMILYTSGTTSRPKGVVTSHANIKAQVTMLVDAWAWTSDDRTLLCLPLHHVHGIINVVACALWSGATCEMLPRFDAQAVWERIAKDGLTVFMAVPTIYVKLLALWDAAPPERRAALTDGCRKLRLMISGSAALPASILERWKLVSGHTLLERYGMTEIGMALSNPLRGARVPGSVGTPLPGVEVRIADESGNLTPSGTPGELEVRGPGVFLEYWRQPEATRQAFRDGWFRTGDTAVVENGVYRLLGRTNIDILKTGGHKLSALEVEEVLRQHPAIAECAVVGVPDPEWGERVAAAVVLQADHQLDLPSLRAWAKQLMAPHKVPSCLLVLPQLPRNAMGKVVKPQVTAMFRS